MWDERYAQKEYVYGTEPNEFLRERVADLPMGRVLCLAEGECRNAAFLAQQGYSVTAVDGSAVALRKAAELAESKGVELTLIHADLTDFELEPGAWDGVVTIFGHLPSSIRRPLYQRVVQGLRSGGVLLLEAYTPAQLGLGTGGPKDLDFLMSSDLVREELAGLRFTHLVETQRQIVEGAFHTGVGAVVQAIGVKE